MSAKRRHDSGASSSPEEDSALQSSKRPRMQAANKQQREAATDATYGQRCVFSSLGDSTVPSDDDLEFEDEGEALAYLRSVRYVFERSIFARARRFPAALLRPRCPDGGKC